MKRLGVLVLVLACSSARADDRPQYRALWVDAVNSSGYGIKTPQQVDQLVADAKELRCNLIVAQVRPRANSLFRNSLEPFSEDAAIPDGFDPLEFVERSRFDASTMLADLRQLAEREIADEPLRRLALLLLDRHAEALKRLPGSARHYHPFAGGWLEHTLAVTRSCGRDW